MVLDGLLLADVGRARKQQIAVGDPNRPMGGEKNLLALAAGDAFFREEGTPGTEQFKADFATIAQLFRDQRKRLSCSHPQLRCRGVVDQQEAALLVLNRD